MTRSTSTTATAGREQIASASPEVAGCAPRQAARCAPQTCAAVACLRWLQAAHSLGPYRPAPRRRSGRRIRRGGPRRAERRLGRRGRPTERSAVASANGGIGQSRAGRRPSARSASGRLSPSRAVMPAPENTPGTCRTDGSQPPCPPESVCPWSAVIDERRALSPCRPRTSRAMSVSILRGNVAVVRRRTARTDARPRRGRADAPRSSAGLVSLARVEAHRRRACPTGSRSSGHGPQRHARTRLHPEQLREVRRAQPRRPSRPPSAPCR